jgi:hypothetical protein
MLDFDLINCFQTLKLVKKFAGKGNSRFRDALNMFECFNMFDIGDLMKCHEISHPANLEYP